MRWTKLGHVFSPDTSWWWARNGYCHLPTATLVSPRLLRVYYAALDENRYGRIGYVDLDAEEPTRVVSAPSEPVLDIGALGSFDDCGVVPSSLVRVGTSLWLYYVGFQRAERVPYMLFTGLATAREGDDDRFIRYSRVPILDRTSDEPFSRSAPCVLVEDGLFRMWYWSCIEWTPHQLQPHYNNVIRYATSPDGIVWDVHPHICIQPDFTTEYSIGRPAVWHHKGLYHMWYSIRSFERPYEIGYAVSQDGIDWLRHDAAAGIAASETGWDSEMICYPNVVAVGDMVYMVYNGNRHGATGFGVARLNLEAHGQHDCP